MDQIENYILSQRAAGQTDDQIKQALASSGWTVDQIKSVFPDSKKPKTILAVGVVIGLLLVFGIGTALKYYLTPTRYNSSIASIPEQQLPNASLPTASLTTTSVPAVVYIKYSPEELNGANSSRHGELTFFDFVTRQSFTPTLPEGQINDFGKIISPWSPYGKKLFILGIKENSLPQPLFIYDNEIKKLSYLFDTNIFPELKGKYNEFNFSSSWIDDQRLQYTQSSSVVIRGNVSSTTAPETHFQSNGRLKILQPEVITVRPQNATLDGKPLPTLKGIIVGMTNKYIVTIERPTFKDPLKDPELEKQLTSIQTEEEARRILEQAYTPKGDSTIYLYPISNPNEEISIPWPGNSWAIESMELLYSKNSLILQEVDSNLVASKNRFTLLNLDNPDIRKIITETGRLDKGNYLLGEGSIGVTSDEQWMLLLLESENPSSNNITGKIVAWSLETNEVLTICEAGCSQLKVYNPNRLRFR